MRGRSFLPQAKRTDPDQVRSRKARQRRRFAAESLEDRRLLASGEVLLAGDIAEVGYVITASDFVAGNYASVEGAGKLMIASEGSEVHNDLTVTATPTDLIISDANAQFRSIPAGASLNIDAKTMLVVPNKLS